MNNQFKVLMGATKNNTLVFGEINFPTERRNHFSVSFSEVSPFVASDEFLRSRFEGFLDGLDSDYKLDALERLDCKYSELEDELYNEQLSGYGVEGIVDISLYADSYPVEGLEDDVYFESDGCGQHDTREYLVPIVKEVNDKVFAMWDKYHLKDAGQIGAKDLSDLRVSVESYEIALQEPEWIQEWLEGLVKEGVL